MRQAMIREIAVGVLNGVVCPCLPALGQPDLAQPGAFAAGWRTVTVTRPPPASGTFTARLHYPSPAAGAGGENAPFDASGAPYPAVSFGHGFVQAVTQYQSTAAHLATHGYLVILSTSEGSISPSHANFAADMRHCLTWLEARNAEAGSELFGAVNTGAFGLSGHSMGGGCSILAAAADARVRCVANMAAAETSPSAIAAMASVRCPVFLISGSQDTIVPVGSHGQLMYNAAAVPKQLPVIAGGFHCGFTDAGFIFCDSGSISRAEQLAVTRRLLTAFFDLHLKGEQSGWREVWGPEAPPGAGGVTLAAAPGFALSSQPADAAVAPGGSAAVALTITSAGPGARSFEVTVESSSAGWSADAVLTPPVEPGPGAQVTLTVRAPGLAGAGASSLLVSVRDTGDGATRAYTTIAAARRACVSDWNGLGGVTVQDIFDFLADYFTQRADFNGVGGTTVQDIFDYLAAYFEPC